VTTSLQIEEHWGVKVLRMISQDGTNRLTIEFVASLTEGITKLTKEARGLVITGNDRFLSAGADLEQIAALDAPSAYEFAKVGQRLMQAVEDFPAPIYAAISGYCMGGGLDLALACHRRIASSHAVFGHRGAALGLITGWGGTQRLPRLIGKGRALEMFVAAEKVSAVRALQIGLVDVVCEEPIKECGRRILSLPRGRD
jgi:enoyl-CoA hydratase